MRTPITMANWIRKKPTKLQSYTKNYQKLNEAMRGKEWTFPGKRTPNTCSVPNGQSRKLTYEWLSRDSIGNIKNVSVSINALMPATLIMKNRGREV